MEKREELIQRLKAACPELTLLEDEPMSGHTSFKVGGPAALMAVPAKQSQLGAVLKTARDMGVEPFFLGNGSNLLVADGGYDGLIVKLGAPEFSGIKTEGTALQAGAAVPLARLAAEAMEKGLTGLEFASGIPGTLGGALVMNAGAYGGEMAQVVTAVTYLDENGEKVTIPGEKCDFSYRNSVFAAHPAWLILRAELALAPGDKEAVKTRMAELAEQRRAKQPLDLPSAGSTFKRPAPIDGVAQYAAALIDRCGCKGLTVGGAQVSEKHAGFIVNRGGATCGDILDLVEQVKGRVLAETGVELELEIKTLGI